MKEAAQQARAGIRRPASLTIDPERLERMWAMTPAQRRQAANRGQLSLGEMLRWAARHPEEVPRVDGEFFFITDLLADSADTGEAAGLWRGDLVPLPDGPAASRTPARHVDGGEALMRVLVVDSDRRRAREHARQLQMDGHRTTLALAASAAA